MSAEFSQEFTQFADDPTQYLAKSGWEKPLFSLVALAVVSLGIQRPTDVVYASVAQFVYWWLGYGKGPEPMYNVLAGIEVARGQYRYAAFPTLLDTYNAFEDFNAANLVTPKRLYIYGVYFLAFLLTKYKLI